MGYQTVNISLPKELIDEVDALARQEFTSRSDIIRSSLLARLKKSRATANKDLTRTLALLDEVAAGLENMNISDDEINAAVRELRGKR